MSDKSILGTRLLSSSFVQRSSPFARRLPASELRRPRRTRPAGARAPPTPARLAPQDQRRPLPRSPLPNLATSELAGVLFFPNSGGLRREGVRGGRQARRWGWQEGGFRVLAVGEAVGPGQGGGVHGRSCARWRPRPVDAGGDDQRTRTTGDSGPAREVMVPCWPDQRAMAASPLGPNSSAAAAAGQHQVKAAARGRRRGS